MCPVDAMEEEKLCAGPACVLLADSGGCACFLVSRLEVAPDGGAGGVEERMHVVSMMKIDLQKS